MAMRFVLVFAHQHTNFAFPELDGLLDMLGIRMEYAGCVEDVRNMSVNETLTEVQCPYVVVNSATEESLHRLLERDIMIRFAIELWGEGTTIKECIDQTLEKLRSGEVRIVEAPYKVEFDTFGKKLSKERRALMFEVLDAIPFKGEVSLEYAQIRYCVLENYGLASTLEEPRRIFFGRLRDLVVKYSLKKRALISNTSMDPELALIMANQAQVKRGSLVLDPFVGSGSLLVACAHFGAYVCGSDIDKMVLLGLGKTTRANAAKKIRGPDENLQATFLQYGLQSRFVDVLVADNSTPSWRMAPTFDAIVTDPPYGIREKAHTAAAGAPVDETAEAGALRSMYRQLLDLAAHILVTGGRLVYWLPVIRSEYSADALPRHACLQTVANVEQVLTTKFSRRLITMVKIHEPSGEVAAGGPADVRSWLFPERTEPS